MKKPIKIFISYAQEDKKHKDDFVTRLISLKRQGLIETWDNEQIQPGQDRNIEIKKELDQAKIIVFLATPDLLGSDHIHNFEIESVLEQFEAKKQIVVPILVRPCDFKSSKLSRFQDLPKGSESITRCNDKDEVWNQVIEEIKKLINKLVENGSVDRVSSKKKGFTLHNFHKHTCNRTKQLSEFNNSFSSTEKTKTRFYFISGTEEQCHWGLVNHLARKKGGYLRNPHNPDISNIQLVLKKFFFQKQGSFKYSQIDLLEQFFSALDIVVDMHGPLLEKDLNFVCRESPLLYNKTEKDFVCILLRIRENDWKGMQELIHWFINDFCNKPLIPDSPNFLFFFGIIFNEDDAEITPSVKGTVDINNYVKTLKPLGKVTYYDLENWFMHYDMIASYKKERATIMEKHFSEDKSKTYDMEDVEIELERIINKFNDPARF